MAQQPVPGQPQKSISAKVEVAANVAGRSPVTKMSVMPAKEKARVPIHVAHCAT